MSEIRPMELPPIYMEVQTPDICAVCHAPTRSRYAVDPKRPMFLVKLCDTHKPTEVVEAKKPKPKADTGQMELL